MTRERLIAVLFPVLVLGALASPGHAQDRVDEAWQRANQAHLAGDHAAAAAGFEQLDRQGVVAVDLYYNQGVTQFRLGNLGHAAWSFERAVALDPDDDDARFNLAQIKKLLAKRTQDKIEGAETEAWWIRLVGVVPPSTLTWLFVVVYGATFGLLFVRRRAGDESRAAVTAGAAIAALLAVMAGGLLAGRVLLDRIPFAIVLPDALKVKEGADASYRTSFEVHAGLRVRLLEQDRAWVRVQLANGLEGWVPRTDVGAL